MFKSRTTLRLITLLFLLAGVLLLRKPVFGQTNLASPQIRGTSLGKKPDGQYNRVVDNLPHIELTFEAMKEPAVCVESLPPHSRYRALIHPREIRLDAYLRNPRITLVTQSAIGAP